jgi:hypothetical protein
VRSCHQAAEKRWLEQYEKSWEVYERYNPDQLTVEHLKSLVWRILYVSLVQSPYLLCQWRPTAHSEAQQMLCCSDDGCMIWLLFEFYLSTDIDSTKRLPSQETRELLLSQA